MLINTSASSEVSMTPFAGMSPFAGMTSFAGTVPSHAARSAVVFPAAGRGISGGAAVTGGMVAGADCRWAVEGQLGGRGDCQAREIQPDGIAAALPATASGSGPVVTGHKRGDARTETSQNTSYQDTSNHNSTNLMARLVPAARGGWGSLPEREPGPA